MSNKSSELCSSRTLQAQKRFQELEQKNIILENFIGNSFY